VLLTRSFKYKSARLIDRVLRIIKFRNIDLSDRTFLMTSEFNGKVLLLSLDQLGDAVMATPVIEALKTNFPACQLTILTRLQNASVFFNNPYLDEVITDEAPWWSGDPIRRSLRPSYWVEWFTKISRIRRERYDAIIDLRGDLRHLLLFGAAAKPKMLFGYDRTGGAALLSCKVPYLPQLHEIDKKLALLAPFGIQGIRPSANIRVSQKELDGAKKMIDELIGGSKPPIVIVDPGAKAVQRWPIDRWAHIVKWLYRKLKKPILISAGPAYRNFAQELALLSGPQACRLVGNMTIRELIAMLASCNIVISSDTGVAHIASAVRVPAVVLYGPTDPDRFWHGVDARGIVRSPLACCCTELHEVCSKPDHPSPGECMSSISLEMVETAVTQILNSFESGCQTKPKTSMK
jgi:heptosyltransferase I